MEPLKLTYFPVRGRVEPARLLLELAGAPYAFEAVGLEAWMQPETKPHFRRITPLGQLPILESGERRLCQSGAIQRYLADRLGLYGSDAAERARIDEVYETGWDLLLNLSLLFWEPEPRCGERRAAHRESFRTLLAALADYFARTRAAPQRWIDAQRYTLGDVMVAYALEVALPLHAGLIEEFPELHGFLRAFFAAPGVAEYVRSPRRPLTYTVALASFGGRPEQTHQWEL